MNKFGVVLGVAAVATLAGCKDPDYKYANQAASQNEVKTVDTTAPVAKPIEVTPIETKCKCPRGTKHTTPCACGASDCNCIVETKSIVVAPKVEEEYTIYIVQNGDYLSKISKKFNVTISSIRRLNPKMKNDMIRIGQKLKLPGKVNVGEQKMPANAVAAKKTPNIAKKAYASYKGATKEYAVKNGDTLGAIAYSHGCNIRQLKEMNGLKNDSLKIGQKLKVPAEKAAAAKTEPKIDGGEAAKQVETKPIETKAVENNATTAAEPVTTTAPTASEATTPAVAPAVAPTETAPAAPATTTYVVKEGEDVTSIAIACGITASQIRELNNLAESDKLTAGQVIKLPAEAQQ